MGLAGIKTADEHAVRETCVQALRHVIGAGGDKMSAPLALGLLATLSGPALLAHADDSLRSAAGGCLGALLHCLPPPHQVLSTTNISPPSLFNFNR